MKNWEIEIAQKVEKIASSDDPAHDFQHFQRVVRTAKALCAEENGKIEVVAPAAWLHDLVIVPKNDPLRNQASGLSAQAAISYLASIGYPEIYFEDIAHAIESHSFSANIPARTKDAQIVQDADRLDGLGAIGIARCFATAGLLRRQFYQPLDPFCESRTPDDQVFTVDHFYQKLFKIAESLKTTAGKAEGQRRLRFMKTYLDNLRVEIC